MPKPLYIICSESGSEDKETGLLSLFSLIDKLQINKNPTPEQMKQAPLTQVRITAAWQREKGDEDNEFEFEVVLKPAHDETFTVGRGRFLFAKMLPLIRISAKIIGPLPIKGEGILWIENKIRKVGSEGWRTQQAPIFVEQLVQQTPEIVASPMEPEKVESSHTAGTDAGT